MFAVSIILGIFVLVRRAVILVAFIALSSSLGNACTCGPNYTPVQRTDERYAEKAVFTAHVVQSIGGIYNLDGVRSSDRVIALVLLRYVLRTARGPSFGTAISANASPGEHDILKLTSRPRQGPPRSFFYSVRFPE